MANLDKYDGKLLSYPGYLVSKEDASGEWILRVALKKTETGYEDLLVVTSDRAPEFAADSPVKIYAYLVGKNIGQTATGEEEALPKLQLALIDAGT